MKDYSGSAMPGNAPYGTGPGFPSTGSEPQFGPGNMGQGSDLPVGFGMLLMEDRLAMQRFTALPKDEKARLLKYVESGTDGNDAQRRIAHAVKSLHDGVGDFYH